MITAYQHQRHHPEGGALFLRGMLSHLGRPTGGGAGATWELHLGQR